MYIIIILLRKIVGKYFLGIKGGRFEKSENCMLIGKDFF